MTVDPTVPGPTSPAGTGTDIDTGADTGTGAGTRVAAGRGGRERGGER